MCYYFPMKRVVAPELLDTDAGMPQEIADSLADLRRINRWFGGTGTTCSMVRRISRQLGLSSLSLLEVAAGSGDIPQSVQGSLRRRGVQLDITLLDRVGSHLSTGASAVAGDALALPFRDASFDLTSCALFAHHLSPEQLLDFVNEGLRVSRLAVLINDLIRHPMHLALVYAGYPLYRSRLTRHDGPASVRQAYTRGEMRGILAGSRAANVEISWHYLFRMGVIVWKHPGK